MEMKINQDAYADSLQPSASNIFEPSLHELIHNVKKEYISTGFLASNPIEALNLRQLKDLLSMLKRKSPTQKKSVDEWMRRPELLEELLVKCRNNKYEFGCSEESKIITNGKERYIYSFRTQDKILQKLIAMILNVIFDDLFYCESFAYRPFKNIKNGMELLVDQSSEDTYALKLDINKCFASIDTIKLLSILKSKISNTSLLRLIQKSLNTYCMIDGKKVRLTGIAQGSIHGPVLCNIFLHYLLDEPMRKEFPKARLFRYADDTFVTFKEETYLNKINQWVELTLNQSNLFISPKTPNISSDLSNEKTFLGFRITRDNDGVKVDINPNKIKLKLLELCLRESPMDALNYLRNRFKSTPLSEVSLKSWKKLLESIPSFLHIKLTSKIGTTRVDSIIRGIEFELTYLLREVSHHLLEQSINGVTDINGNYWR